MGRAARRCRCRLATRHRAAAHRRRLAAGRRRRADLCTGLCARRCRAARRQVRLHLGTAHLPGRRARVPRRRAGRRTAEGMQLRGTVGGGGEQQAAVQREPAALRRELARLHRSLCAQQRHVQHRAPRLVRRHLPRQ